MCNEVRLTCLHPVRKWVTWGPWKHCCIYLQKSSLSLLWIGWYLPWAKIEQGSAHSAQTSKTMPGVHIVPCKGDRSYCSLFYRGQTYLAISSGPPSSFWSLSVLAPLQHTMKYRRFQQSLPRGTHARLWFLGLPAWVAGLRSSSACPTQPAWSELCRTLWPCLCRVWHCCHCWAVTSQGMVPLERLRRFSGKTWGVYVPSSAWE